MNFAETLNKLAREKHISNYRIAAKLNVHQTTVKNWLDGKTLPKSDKLCELAHLLDVSTDFLLGEDGQNIKPTTNDGYELSNEEQENLDLFLKLNDKQRLEVLGYMRYLASLGK